MGRFDSVENAETWEELEHEDDTVIKQTLAQTDDKGDIAEETNSGMHSTVLDSELSQNKSISQLVTGMKETSENVIQIGAESKEDPATSPKEGFYDAKSEHRDDSNKCIAINQNINKEESSAGMSEKETVSDRVEFPEEQRTPSIIDTISGMMGAAVGLIRRSSTEASATENISNNDSIESMSVETNVAEKVEAKDKMEEGKEKPRLEDKNAETDAKADEEDKETATLENEKSEAKAKEEPRGGTELLDNKVEANNAKAEADDKFKEEAEDTAILATADYIAKDKGKMGKKGRDKKAEVEKYPRLEPKEFKTKA